MNFHFHPAGSNLSITAATFSLENDSLSEDSRSSRSEPDRHSAPRRLKAAGIRPDIVETAMLLSFKHNTVTSNSVPKT